MRTCISVNLNPTWNPRRIFGRAAFLAVAMLVGCGDDTPPDTGLTGVMLRGPVAPVCSEAEPCEAPFAATFSAVKDGHTVRTFASGADGAFTVMLEPGGYRIVPANDAPILDPASQAKDVVVADTGLVLDTLRFDTGIR